MELRLDKLEWYESTNYWDKAHISRDFCVYRYKGPQSEGFTRGYYQFQQLKGTFGSLDWKVLHIDVDPVTAQCLIYHYFGGNDVKD